MKIELTIGSNGARRENPFMGAWCRVNATFTRDDGRIVTTSYFFDEITPGFVVLTDRPAYYCELDGWSLGKSLADGENGAVFASRDAPGVIKTSALAAEIVSEAQVVHRAHEQARKMAVEKMRITAPA
jgi:hypothetical protein